jgi:two-component system KDP operon response regulator KdpE
LTGHGYTVFEAGTGEEAVQAMPAARPDLVVLDLGLPGMSGLDVIRSIRQWTSTPIIVLSVRDEETDKVQALDAGADDYVTKPFGLGELLARMRVALRSSSGTETGTTFSIRDLKVDLARREVLVGERKVHLTPTEYELLKVLIAHPGKVLTHQHLLHKVWGGLSYVDEVHMLRVNMSNLRKKLEPDPTRPRYIVTEPGVGYRLQAE